MTENKLPKLLKARQYHSRIFAAVMILLLLFCDSSYAAGEFPRACMMWVGYILVIFGAMGRGYCSAFIGGRKNETVVREGPFSVVRNPLYVFSFIAVLGIGLQSGMWTVFVLLTAAYMLYYPAVVRKEEGFLHHKFGDDYLKYMQEVPRWIPNLKLWNEPEVVETKPQFLRKTLMDAAIFFVPMPIFALLSHLHANGTLPVWLTLS